MNDIFLHNTLSGKKELFKPIRPDELSMYNCGPTVYDDAHVGNLRAYVFADLLRRTFEFNGYGVKQIINVTDVGHLTSDADEGEDKMSKALKREGKPFTVEAMREIGTIYFERFKEDMKALNVETPQGFPRASDHIQDDIELVRDLEKKGFTYKITDGIYFDTAKFKGYGKLGNIDFKGIEEGARIGINPEKMNATDFALWKFDTLLGWESPWGKGFPGWHVECSAMSRKYLGQPFDIHTGGIDHIPVHHNNEIAQSEAAYDKPLAHYWLHNEHLIIDGAKVAKSAGTGITLKTLSVNGVTPLTYRYWLLTAHYRSPVNFTYDAVKASQNAFLRLTRAFKGYPEGGKPIPAYTKRFIEAINDDLDMPKAVAIVWDVLKDSDVSDADKKATLIDFDNVFGLGLSSLPHSSKEEIPEAIQKLITQRNEARASKDWKKSDELRDEIEVKGFKINDTPDGTEVNKE